MIAFKAPPVCTAWWNDYDWARYIAKNGVETEPETIRNSFGLWVKTGEKDDKGDALYHLKEPAFKEKK